MTYPDEAEGLKLRIQSHGHAIPEGTLAKMREDLHSLEKVVEEFPVTDLHVDIHRHPRRGDLHVKTALRLPKRTIFTGERHAMLHPAYERCLRKLVNKVKAYKEKLRGKPERERSQQGAVREIWPEREPDFCSSRP